MVRVDLPMNMIKALSTCMHIQEPLRIIKGISETTPMQLAPSFFFFIINACHVNMNMFARFDSSVGICFGILGSDGKQNTA